VGKIDSNLYDYRFLSKADYQKQIKILAFVVGCDDIDGDEIFSRKKKVKNSTTYLVPHNIFNKSNKQISF